MDPTEWIALTIVGLAAAALIGGWVRKKKRKNCCAKGCPLDPGAEKSKQN